MTDLIPENKRLVEIVVEKTDGSKFTKLVEIIDGVDGNDGIGIKEVIITSEPFVIPNP